MRKRTATALMLALALAIPMSGQTRSGGRPWAPDIWPGYWYGNEEFVHHTLPVGGWNTIGSFSFRGLAMGETFLSASDGTAGYLNPALLTALDRPVIAVDYRWSENAYRTSSWPEVIPMMGPWAGNGDVRSFKRSMDDIAAMSLALPFGDWALSASYFRFQDFGTPRIDGFFETGLESVEQSGGLRGVNLAIAACLTSSFSLGVSASYLFGDIRRTEILAPVYWILEGSVSPSDPGGSVAPIWSWPSTSERYDLDMKGFSYAFGAAFEPNEKWMVGLTIRPPFAIDIEAGLESLYLDGISVPVKTWGSFFEKQPFTAVGSVRFRPARRFELTADVSFWGWSGATSDYGSSWAYARDFKGVVKLNIGAEYKVALPFRALRDLSLRAGYIHDPQPYRYAESYARDHFCAGFGLSLGAVEVGFSAKLGLAARELRRFHANVFQAGAAYKF